MNLAPLPRARMSALALALCLFASCGGGGGASSSQPHAGGGNESTPPPFTLATSESSDFELQVLGDGDPLAGAVVILSSVRQVAELEAGDDPALLGGETFFRGMTDAEGRVSGTLRVPSRHLSLDVIVNARGFEGPYSVEALRTSAGAFAPSARVTKTRVELESATIALNRP